MKMFANFCDFFEFLLESSDSAFCCFSILAFDRNFSRGFNGIYLEHFSMTDITNFS